MRKTRDKFTGQMMRRLWWPALASSLGWALSDMADAIVVGQRLGAVGLAAISLILPIYMINCMFAHGLGLGGSVRYAGLLSRGQQKQAQDSFRGVILLALILSGLTAICGNLFLQPLLSVLGTTADDGALYAATRDYLRILVSSTPLFYLSNILNYYLRNDGSQRLAGLGSVVGNLCDIGMNVLFVLVLDLGTRGAALSTTLGQVISIGIYLPGYFRRDHALRLGLPPRGRIRSSLAVLKAGLATSVQYLYQMVFFLLCNNLLLRLGGASFVAIFDVLQNTSYLILYLFEGTGRAMQPILSTYSGERDAQGTRNALHLGFLYGLCAGGALIALLELWPQGICLLFGIATLSEHTPALYALRLYGIAAVFAGINILLCTYHQACGQEKSAFVLETLRGAALLLPLTFLCYRLGTSGFWWLFLLTEALSLLIFRLLGRFLRPASRAQTPIFQQTVMSNATDVMDATQALEAFCRAQRLQEKQLMLATMTMEEVCMAILRHGFQGRTDGYIRITAFATEDGLLELHLRDDALTFNPFSMQTRKAGTDGDFDVDSMGILVIKKRAKNFYYRRYQGFNTLIVQI